MMHPCSPALCAPSFATLFVFHAIYLDIPLVLGSNDEATTGTDCPTTTSRGSRSAHEPCTSTLVDVGVNLSVVENCVCQENIEDDDDGGGFVIYYPNARNSAGSVIVESRLGPSDSTKRSPWVPDGTLCQLQERAEPGGTHIDVGVCKSGNCSEENRTTYYVRTTPPPAYDPYAHHCQVPTSALNSKLQVASKCVGSCYDPINRVWYNASLNDGRLCDLVIYSGDTQYLKRSGTCRNGSCVEADWTPWDHRCKISYVRRNGINLVEKCAVYCKNNRMAKVRDGTRCWRRERYQLRKKEDKEEEKTTSFKYTKRDTPHAEKMLNYQRRVHVPDVDDIIVDGICKHGHCIITPPTIPILMTQVPEEGCYHFTASINYTHRVEASCKAFCYGHEQHKPVQPGTACALKTTGRWQSVTEVGECVRGSCTPKYPMETPPPHKQADPKLRNCRDKIVTVQPHRLAVVESCQVECSYAKFEKRKNGVSCLLEYSVTKEGEKTYTVGVCIGGRCILGRHPRNITTQD